MSKKIIGIPESYKQYRKDYKEPPYQISSVLYRKILKELMIEIKNSLLLGKEIKLPLGLGKIYISRNRASGSKKNSVIDWQKSKIVGKKITFHNLHSNDYVMRLKWDKYKSVVKNRTYYKLLTLRPFKRQMAEYMKNNNTSIYFISSSNNQLKKQR